MRMTASRSLFGRSGCERVPRRRELVQAAAVISLMVGCGDLSVDGDFAGEEDVTVERAALTATADQALVITTPSVIRNTGRTGDPCSSAAGDENTKEWSFGYMMKEEAANRNVSVSTFVNSFMDAWTTTANINGQTVPPSWGPKQRDSWRFFAGGSTALPLHKAPFQLIAIVNRLDLRRHRTFGEPLGGELRFVFGFHGASQNNPPCPSGTEAEAAMIVEYSPNKIDENEVKDYGRRWLDLSTMSVGTEAYRTALQALTDEVIKNGKLLRIRTNELRHLATGKTWDLTELEPNPTTGLFRRVTVKQSPTMALINGSQAMSDWIWANRGPLFANAFDFEWARANRTVTEPPIGSYSVPNTFPATSTFFRGGFTMIGADPAADPAEFRSFPGFWGGPKPTGLPAGSEGAWSEARFRFSIGTCNGCHSSETGTGILHISPAEPEAQRSPWLRGIVTVVDPVTGATRSFDEMSRRETDLRKLVNGVAVMNPVLGNNYTVRFRTSGRCLDLPGESSNDGVLSQLWACHGRKNQRLSLVEVTAGSGVYNLKYKHSGKCIDVANASTSNGARVEQRTCSSARNSQKLTLSAVFTGALPTPRLLKFQHSNLCLLVQNNGTSDGTAIVQGTCPTTDQTKAFDLVE